MTATTNQEKQIMRKGTNKSLVLLIACVAQFMVVLDLSIVNVALPSIKVSLGYSSTDLQWILNAYTISFAGLLLLGGRIADVFGRRKVFIYGLYMFIGASLLGAIATNQWELILARVLQGIGAAVVSPATLTIITTTFEVPRERAKALGAWSAVAGAGGAAGALFGGVLTNYLSWRWTFLINLPIGGIELLLTFMYLSELRRPRQGVKLDILGSVLITAGISFLVFGLVQGGNLGWSNSETLSAFILAAALIAVFAIFETKYAHSPIIPMKLLASRSLGVANAAMFMVGAAIFASWYFMSLYMQEVLGYTPLQAGLAFVPQTLAIMVGAQISSRIVTKLGVRPLAVFGPLITALGLVMLSSISPSSTYVGTIMLPSVLITLGMGLCFTPLALAATSGVDRAYAGLASGVLNTARQVGGAVGLAGLSSAAVSIASGKYLYLTHQLHVETHLAVLDSTSHGYAISMALSAALAVTASAVALMLPSKSVRGSEYAAKSSELVMEIGFEGA